MPATTLMPYGERRRIWGLYKDLGVPAPRISHVRHVVSSYLELQRCNSGHFFRILSPDNRRYEDRTAYTQRIEWLFDLNKGISPEGRANLEAGIRLHDIGRTEKDESDHEIVGGDLLRDGTIFKKLRLSPGLDLEAIWSMVRHHGLFSDIGFLYKPQTAASMSREIQDSLYVLSAVDTTAKPRQDWSFHSMLFSRILDRYRQFRENGITVDPQSRLRQLFGPLNYVWLDDSSMAQMDGMQECRDLKERAGFSIMVARSFVHCWPLFKDMVTHEIAIGATYYTETEPSFVPDLMRLMHTLSDVIETTDNGKDFLIRTDPETRYSDLSNRPAFLSNLRRSLRNNDAELVRTGEKTFKMDSITFTVSEGPEITQIDIGG